MMNKLSKFLLSSLLLLLTPTLTLGQEDEVVRINDLDFPRQVYTDQFIFFPVKRASTPKSKVGVVWYNRFFNTIDNPQPSGDHDKWKTMGVNVSALAADEEHGKYLEFFSDPNLVDIHWLSYWNPLPNSRICSFTDDLKKNIIENHSGIEHGHGLSWVCSGVLTVHEDKVNTVRDILLANRGIRVKTQFQGCSKESPIVRFNPIADELRHQGYIDKTWGKGRFFDIMWAIDKMKETHPEYFGGYVELSSVDFLAKLYLRSKNEMPIARVDAAIANEAYLDCKPKEYTYSYGD